jgi:hypothetical protein
MIDRIGIAFGEASTWRGIIMLLTAIGLQIEPAQQTAIIQAGLAIVGLISVFFKRKTPAV